MKEGREKGGGGGDGSILTTICRNMICCMCNALQTSYADSGVVDESSSSPDESLSSITTTRISMGGDENWDDLLLHLKKEL